MAQFDTNVFSVLLEEKKFEEAQQLLEQYYTGDLTREEAAASAYYKFKVVLELQNSITSDYLEKLNDTLEALNELDVYEQEEGSHIDMNAVRNQIKSL